MNRQILVDDWKTFASEMPPIDGSEILIGIPFDFVVIGYYGPAKEYAELEPNARPREQYCWRHMWDCQDLEDGFGDPIAGEWVWQKIHYPKCVPIKKHQ